MAFDRYTDDISYVSKMDTHPNASGGLSADEVKAAFDQSANAIQTWINETLLPALEGDGAENIGITPIAGLVGALTVQAALESLYSIQKDMSQGSVADAAITTAKLADQSVTLAKLADGLMAASNITGLAAVATSGSYNDLADLPTLLTESAMQSWVKSYVSTLDVADSAVTTSKIADGAVTYAKLASAAITSIRSNVVTYGTSAPGTLADGQIYVQYS